MGNEKKYGVQKLCVLKIKKNILNVQGVVCSDQNATSSHVKFYDSVDIVKKEKTFVKNWAQGLERKEYFIRRSAICAEVLVPKKVDPQYIEGVFCSSKKTFPKEITSHLNEKNISIIEDPYLFFESTKESDTLEWF